MAVDECGNLIWDYSSGDVICLDTGEVVDRIYSYAPVHVKEEAMERARIGERKRFRRYGYRPRLRKHYRLLKLAKSFSSRGYVVDYDRLFSGERFVLTIYSRRTLRVLEWLEEKGIRHVLDRVINALMEREPYVLARTIRGRYVLAYLVYELLNNRNPLYRQLNGLSEYVGENMFKQLKKLARSLLAKHRGALEEAVKE